MGYRKQQVNTEIKKTELISLVSNTNNCICAVNQENLILHTFMHMLMSQKYKKC